MDENGVDERGRVFGFGRWYPNPETRAALQPLAEAWRAIRTRIEEMTDDDLAKLLEALDEGDFTTTNCGWAEYEVIRAFGPRIRNETVSRLRASQEAEPANQPAS